VRGKTSTTDSIRVLGQQSVNRRRQQSLHAPPSQNLSKKKCWLTEFACTSLPKSVSRDKYVRVMYAGSLAAPDHAVSPDGFCEGGRVYPFQGGVFMHLLRGRKLEYRNNLHKSVVQAQ